MKREQYEKLFESFPDVLTLPELCKMLGGIGDGTARYLLQGEYIEHFVIRHTYYVPKCCAIDYLMSKHYRIFKKKLRHQIEFPKGGEGK